ncbi:protein phosphatase 2C domain-containing protein [Sphingomonas sp.]|uniref:PP2C family protein-serine/threonine phosphatase n=1 Tax=Sphingomonas sp. TaxID=28214 RepID=UPI00286D179B|nr:protein phosphatase 2C domain-containing protein [Sphingomonas sp.]
MLVESISRTHVGLRRKVNEDSFLDRPELGLWVVADGMGGHDAGEIASTMITNALSRAPVTRDLGAASRWVEETLSDVNEELISFARTGDRPRTIGSTVVGLLIEGPSFVAFWAGDSRAYRLRDGELSKLTHDHSLVQGLVDAGMLAAEDAETHPQASVITRAVGVARIFSLEMVTGDVQSGDRFLLASDGLTRLVPDPELCAALADGPLAPIADRLVETVLQRGAPDNVTLTIIAIA